MAVPGTVTISELVGALKTSLLPITSVLQVQAELTMTESIPEVPLIQIYLENLDLTSTRTDRRTMGSTATPPRRQFQYTMHVDIYGRQRSEIGQDLVESTNILDDVLDVLIDQNQKPYFGLDAINSFTFKAERVSFEYNEVMYAGFRVIVDLSVI